MKEEHSLPTPHNNFFQFALSGTKTARSLIETQFPAELLAEINLDTLRVENGSFVDPDLHTKRSDMLFSVETVAGISGEEETGSDKVLLYFLVEHKSEPDSKTVLQLLSYIVRLLEQTLRDGGKLAPVIPLVLYHGKRQWKVARSLDDLIPASKVVRQFQVRFGFPILDLSRYTNESIEGNSLLQVTLRMLKYSRDTELAIQIAEILTILRSAGTDFPIKDWLDAITVYAMAANKDMTPEKMKQTVASVFPTQFYPGSMADKLLEEGREEGLEKGLEKGRAEGKLQMLQDLLGDPITSDKELAGFELKDLNDWIDTLQTRIRSRDV